jgi:tRNA (guanine37-N1)-methyltransferase
MNFHATILTLFPDMFPGPLGHSLIGRALKEGIWSLDCIDIRDYGAGKHRNVDDTPYGGGAGMVMRADVLGAAIDAALTKTLDAQLIYMSPRGEPLTQTLAQQLSSCGQPQAGAQDLGDSAQSLCDSQNDASLIILCGRFEGIDERIIEHYQPLEISLGDFVMTGGELAAMALLDACVRLLPDVIGQPESLAQESFGLSQDYACMLEHPHYTSPPVWHGLAVPDVLKSGHHAHIQRWRTTQAEEITKTRRPDLWAKHKE